MEVKNIFIGADPELFLKKDNEIVSAEGIIGGTKYEPKPIDKLGNAIQEDNVMIEFNIPPCNTKKYFLQNINFVKNYLSTFVKLKGYELSILSSANLDKKYLKSKQAKTFGCEPDYNVYLKDVNIPPSSKGTLRTCGGHIHIGYDNPNQETTEMIVYAMDICLGLDSIILDNDKLRRTMYGKAGSFRFKNYGVEYRTLSNFWIKNNKTISWAYDSTIKAIKLVNSGKIKDILKLYEKDIQECIDSSDTKKSIELSLKINELVEKSENIVQH